MLSRFSISRFRCFRRLQLEKLDRVNLIAGKNSVGKTALLEALFLHAGPGNPELPLRINAFRIQAGAASVPQSLASLFYDLRLRSVVRLSGRDVKGGTRTLTIRSTSTIDTASHERKTSDGRRQLIGGDASTTRSTLRGLLMEYRVQGREVARSVLRVTEEGFEGERAQLDLPLGVFLNARKSISNEDVERFSGMVRRGRDQAMIETLRVIEPRLEKLAVLAVGGSPVIHGDIGVGELLPIQLLGEGLGKVLSIVAAISEAPGGIVLVDEIENGLHHSVMIEVWKAIAAAARASRAQVFATTHSRECIAAAHRAFSEDGRYDFRLHRLERGTEDIEAVRYDQDTLAAALEAELEVR